jgi:hypothetical protein
MTCLEGSTTGTAAGRSCSVQKWSFGRKTFDRKTFGRRNGVELEVSNQGTQTEWKGSVQLTSALR